MADYGSGGVAGGWEFAAAADREQQAARLRNALVAAQLGQAQRAEAQQNALREQLQRATEGPEVDMNAISRALIAGGDTAAGVNILKMQQQERTQQAEQNAMRQLFHVEQPMQQAPAAPQQQPNLSFLSPRDQAAVQADMARNPTAPAQFSNAPGLARTPPQWGQGMPLNQPAAPQVQQPQQGGILGPYLSHPNRDIQAMAQQVQQLAAAGLFKDRADLNAAVEKVANAAVQAGNIDRGMAGGALTPAIDAAGRPIFIQAGRGGAGVQQVPGFAPLPSKTAENAPPTGFRWKADGTSLEPIPGGPQDKANVKLPASALKLQQQELEALGTVGGVNSDIGALIKQIDEGKLQLGPIRNVASQLQNLTGQSTETSRNFASFMSTMESLRNATLILQKGVQTEGDAQRAWQQIMSRPTDVAMVRQQLDNVRRLNERAADLRRANIDTLRSNFGAEPLNVEPFINRPAAVGGASSPTRQQIDDLLKKY